MQPLKKRPGFGMLPPYAVHLSAWPFEFSGPITAGCQPFPSRVRSSRVSMGSRQPLGAGSKPRAPGLSPAYACRSGCQPVLFYVGISPVGFPFALSWAFFIASSAAVVALSAFFLGSFSLIGKSSATVASWFLISVHIPRNK